MKIDSAVKIPSSWELSILERIAEVNPKLDKTQFEDDLDVSFVPMPAVSAESGAIDVSELKQFSDVKKGYTAFQEKDVLFAKITPCMENGKMAVVPTVKNGLGFGSTEFHVLRTYLDISPQYVYYYVSSKLFRLEAEHNMTGAVGQRRVPAPWLSAVEILLPPFQEQHRIVAKVEELFSELDKGIESLKTAREQLKVYRQALLKHAFEGKLTEQWRKDREDAAQGSASVAGGQEPGATKLETAEQLLERIKQEREARYQQQLEEWEVAVKLWESNGKEKKRPVRPRKPKWQELVTNGDHLPEGWVVAKCENITYEITDGDHQAPPKQDHGIPFITISNIDKNKCQVDFSDTFYVGDDYYNSLKENRKARRGDILYTVTGSFGIPVLIDFDKEFCFQRHIGLISPVDTINRGWLFYLLKSPTVYSQAENTATGTAQKTVALSSLREFELPICSVDEQREILTILDQRLSTVEILERDLSEQLLKSEALRQSILKKAFSGQLVTQDPNDEPASVLLDRIAKEKEEASAKPKKAKAAKKKQVTRKAS